jgi:methionyl aminopeptidase
MIIIKDASAITKMKTAGLLLADMFASFENKIISGLTTAEIDSWVSAWLVQHKLESKSLGYHGYRHVSCIAVNDEIVHGVPSDKRILKAGDLVKVDVCASWSGYAADMARCFFVDGVFTSDAKKLVDVACLSLDKGIGQAYPGNRLTSISAAIQKEVESHGFGVVRDFAGHGIGRQMHEDPEILNYGKPGKGPLLKEGMAFALEPMITAGSYQLYIADDGWTAKTHDRSLAAHVEDTIVITSHGPEVITRHGKNGI